MVRKILISGLPILIVFFFSGCVSKNAFEMMENEAKNLDAQMKELQGKHDNLSREKDVLEEEKSLLSAEKAELIRDNKNLNEILEAKSDSLSRIIAQLRQEKAEQAADYEVQIGGLEDRLTELGLQNIAMQSANDGLIAELQALKVEIEKEVQEMSSTYEELLNKMKSEIDKGQITISELEGKLTVNMVDAILFDSGKSEVKKEGLVVLQKVVDILMNVTDKAIRIEGHTDNVQIGGVLAARYPTNWELSAARAVNVTRFLQAQGLEPENLGAVAYGEYKPVADNDSEEGRAMNRRIEIILVAKE